MKNMAMSQPHTIPGVPAYPIPYRTTISYCFQPHHDSLWAYIVQSAGEAWEKSEDGKADTEARPQAELSLELCFVSKRSQYLFIGGILAVVDGEIVAL